MSTAHAPSVTVVPVSHLHSSQGVSALISQACARHESMLLGHSLTPLFPEACPWDSVAAVPDKVASREAPALNSISAAVIDYRSGLTATAGHLTAWLDASEEDIRSLAMQFAKLDLSDIPDLSDTSARDTLLALPAVAGFPGMAGLLSHPVLPKSPIGKKLLWAESLLGGTVPGKTPEAQFARMSDARFWRRAIRVLLMREREHFFLRLHLVGKSTEAYVSDVQLGSRLAQLKRQAEWMKETALVPRYLLPGEATDNLLTLEQVASTPRTRFAKLYAFVKAMDAISTEQGLATAMLTLTLEPKWHPNPSHGANSWNGATPRAAHQSMALRWQSILRDLDRLEVGVSGLRVVEPHKDACPHWHLWLLYQPAAEQSILETVMRYFPNKLKVRNPSVKRSAKRAKSAVLSSAGDVIFETLDALKASASRVPTHAKEGAQVELARIDRSISSGASYAMKYMLKTVDGGDALNTEAGLFPETDIATTPQQTKEKAELRAQHVAAARRVDAYRSLWGINAGQLFGVAKCLTAWDELRRLADAPKHPLLKKLWALARGSDKEGRIGAGEAIRGDAKGFIEALGGLAACGKAPKDSKRVSIGRLTEQAVNGYGETIDCAKGVTLVERTCVRVQTGTRTNKKTGKTKPVMAWRSFTTVLASIKTRSIEWTMAPKKHLAVAVQLAEQRMLAQLNGGRPQVLGALAVRAFWSALWDGVALHGAEPPPESLPWLLATA